MAIAEVTDRSITELVSLAGRRAVVTGGARGLGAAIARRLAEAGASVLVGDIDDDGAEALAAEIGGRATHLDVSDGASIIAAADAAVTQLGGLDIWVNNAGIYPSTPVLEMDDDEWDRVLGINLRGTFIGSREAARRMVAAGKGGVIVNLSSAAGLRGRGPGIPHYAASKHGIVGLTRQMALEFAGDGIRVLGVAPLRVLTPGVEEAMAGAPPDQLVPMTPLGRGGVADDVARVVFFCVSDLSLFMTGSTVPVDAGDLAR
jgi:NAD(P)-dependent dehydrogenase (short-subunit alcohol dehydrogenase family)